MPAGEEEGGGCEVGETDKDGEEQRRELLMEPQSLRREMKRRTMRKREKKAKDG